MGAMSDTPREQLIQTGVEMLAKHQWDGMVGDYRGETRRMLEAFLTRPAELLAVLVETGALQHVEMYQPDYDEIDIRPVQHSTGLYQSSTGQSSNQSVPSD